MLAAAVARGVDVVEDASGGRQGIAGRFVTAFDVLEGVMAEELGDSLMTHCLDANGSEMGWILVVGWISEAINLGGGGPVGNKRENRGKDLPRQSKYRD